MLPTEQILRYWATKAFDLGMHQGAYRATPLTRYKLIAELGMHKIGADLRRFHIKKIRQVYGAGFDIAAATKRLKGD